VRERVRVSEWERERERERKRENIHRSILMMAPWLFFDNYT
jgi:hypothetical protein